MLRKIRTVRSFSTKFAKYAKLSVLPITVATLIASCGNDNLQSAEDYSSGLNLGSNKNSTKPFNTKPGTTIQPTSNTLIKDNNPGKSTDMGSVFSNNESSNSKNINTSLTPSAKNNDPLKNPPVLAAPDGNNKNNNRTKPNTSPKADAAGNSSKNNDQKAGVLTEDFVDNIGNEVKDVLRDTEKIGENIVTTVIDAAKGGLTIATDLVEDGIYEIESFAGVKSPKFADTNLKGDLKNIGNKLGNDIGNIAKSTINLGADVVGDTSKMVGDLARDAKNDAKYIAGEFGLGNMSFSDEKNGNPAVASSSPIKKNIMPTRDKLPLTTPSNKSGDELERHNKFIVNKVYKNESEDLLSKIYEDPIIKNNEVFEDSNTIAGKLLKYSKGGYDKSTNHMLVSLPLHVKDSNGDFKDRGVNIADVNLQKNYSLSSEGNYTWLEVEGKFFRKVQNEGKLEFAWGDDIRDIKIKLNLPKDKLKDIEKGFFD